MKQSLRQRQFLQNTLRLRIAKLLITGSVPLLGGYLVLVYLGVLGRPEKTVANPMNAPVMSFTNPTLVSGSAGAVNARYLFEDVTSGVDAWVTIQGIYNSSWLSTIDQPASSTGYNEAFQPIVGMAGGTSGSPTTSYIEWKIQFKKANTSADTVFQKICATAIDVDGGTIIHEMVEAFTPRSYSIDPVGGTELAITKTDTSVRAVAGDNNYSGIDTINKVVMFQMNFENVSTIIYRIGAVNLSGSNVRNTSVYFKPFFSDFTPLPVSLLYFKAAIDNATVQLRWATASEENNDYFTVEKSTDGQAFVELVRVPGSGTITSPKNYSATDLSPFPGRSYYRLRQTDYNGQSTLFSTVAVNNTGSETAPALTIDQVSPNPFTDRFSVQFTSPTGEEAAIAVADITGRVYYSTRTQIRSGTNTFSFNEGSRLQQGYYMVTVNDGHSVQSRKLLKKD